MDNLRGSLLMVAAMAGFALEDLFIKRMSATVSTGQIILMLGFFGAIAFGLLARVQGAPLVDRAALSRPVLLRNLGEVVGTVGFITALALAPISTVSAILQALPLAVTMGAAVLYGEKVGWRRWSAISVGFAGMLLVVRPFGAAFEPGALFAVLAVLGLGMRDLATRSVPAATSSAQLACWALVAIVPAGLLLMPFSPHPARLPDPGEWADFAGVLGFGLIAYWCLTAATRAGDVAVVAPFRYSRLVFAILLGILFLGERPDATMLIGAALIIGSGLYTLARERRLAARRALSSGSPGR